MFKDYLEIKRQQRELDKKINSAKKVGKGVLVGLSLGTLATMILTPVSGKKLRSNVKDGVVKTKDFTVNTTHNIGEKAGKVKQEITNKSSELSDKFSNIKSKFVKPVREIDMTQEEISEDETKE